MSGRIDLGQHIPAADGHIFEGRFAGLIGFGGEVYLFTAVGCTGQTEGKALFQAVLRCFGNRQRTFFQVVCKRFTGYLVPLDLGGLIGRDNIIIRGIDLG